MNLATKICPTCGHAMPSMPASVKPAARRLPPPLPAIVMPAPAIEPVAIAAPPAPVAAPVAAPVKAIETLPAPPDPELPPAPASVVAPKAPEGRRFERCDLEIGVDIASDHNFYTGFSSNISEGGIFIATHVLRPEGSTLAIRFTLPGDETPICVNTEVRWVREHNECSNVEPGLGLRFLDITDEDAARVLAFIQASRDPLFFDE